MGYTWITTKTTGVRYREHPTRKNGAVKKDRYFTIRYRVNGVLKEEGLGWASEGWTEEKAGLKRAELREAYRTGSGCITLEEQRAKHNKEKEAENLRLQEESRLNITLEGFYNNYFINFAKNNKSSKTFASEYGYYKKWLLPELGSKIIKGITIIDLENLKTKLLEHKNHLKPLIIYLQY